MALHLQLAEIDGLEVVGDEVARRAADQHAAGGRHLLQARGEGRRVAHGGVVHAQIVADAADHDDAGVQADAHHHAELALGLEDAAVVTQRALNVEGGLHGAARAVLERPRRTEERHHAVAGVLVDRAFEAVHRVGDETEAVVHDLVHVFGVALLGQTGEVDQIGEQDRDAPPLAVDRRAPGQHGVGEVFGCVPCPRRVRCRCRRVGAERGAALPAEARPGAAAGTTLRAAQRQRRPAGVEK